MSAASKPAAASPIQEFLSWFPFHDFFSLDIRSLAVLRIGLGFMLLQEWLNRFLDLREHYTDAGEMPRVALGNTGPFSLFVLSGEAWWPATLMAIGCVLALILVAGWRTQFITFLCWILLIGVHGRNFAILQGGDQVFRMVLFWSIFLPLGACYSLDALREPLRHWRPRVLSPGSVAFIGQVVMLYLFAAAWKTDGAWRVDLTAVYMALSLDSFVSPIGRSLLNFPYVLKGLAGGTILLETFGPALLFIPFANGPVRVLVICSFIMFHCGLGLCMELGNFPWICSVAWLALLPAWFWNRLEARLRSPKRSGLVIYFDGDNAWHRTCVEAVRMVLFLYETKMISAQEDDKRVDSAAGKGNAKKAQEMGVRLGRLRAAASPWLVANAEGKEWLKYDALLQVVQASLLSFPFSRVLTWAPIRRRGERLLRWVAGQRAKPRTEQLSASAYPGARLGGWIQNTIVCFCLVYVLFWNLRTLDISPHQTHYGEYFPEQMNGLGSLFGLEQGWGLFAPMPGRSDGWYVIPAKLKNGKVVDIFQNGAPLTADKPPLVSATYVNTRKRKYLMNLINPEYGRLLPFFAKYLANEWNSQHGPDEQIEYMFILFMLKLTQPDRQVEASEIKELRLWVWPEEKFGLDPITKQPYPGESMGGVLGVGTRSVMYEFLMRPVLPELMKEGR